MELTTGLTAAWLDAVRRAQSDMTQRYARQVPESQPSYQERTLGDVIERAIKAGGAAPPAESRSQTTQTQQATVAQRPAPTATVPKGVVGRILDIEV
ncbi:hypothetical protein CCR97_12660 [Rhodoplanes elegans]|uniref:Uncharacterized protein n=1 Tax=Rhodoplanes elegans TaxID=29408 RepID=A0A327K655_9BRAD|nr:hypothetical protein [Rhodoplanes elegans]MBK5959054.1 hypothetical protein [Rhodoplanes elegans]RAI33233.1 hypothetical protein CH338_22900 [Rhodoplanes elegans]